MGLLENILGILGQKSEQASDWAEQSKSDTVSRRGIVKNTGLNILQQLLSVPQAVSGAANLQSQYGSPSNLLMRNPLQYANIMSKPITGYAQHLSDYSPLSDVLSGNLAQYPQSV